MTLQYLNKTKYLFVFAIISIISTYSVFVAQENNNIMAQNPTPFSGSSQLGTVYIPKNSVYSDNHSFSFSWGRIDHARAYEARYKALGVESEWNHVCLNSPNYLSYRASGESVSSNVLYQFNVRAMKTNDCSYSFYHGNWSADRAARIISSGSQTGNVSGEDNTNKPTHNLRTVSIENIYSNENYFYVSWGEVEGAQAYSIGYKELGDNTEWDYICMSPSDSLSRVIRKSSNKVYHVNVRAMKTSDCSYSFYHGNWSATGVIPVNTVSDEADTSSEGTEISNGDEVEVEDDQEQADTSSEDTGNSSNEVDVSSEDTETSNGDETEVEDDQEQESVTVPGAQGIGYSSMKIKNLLNRHNFNMSLGEAETAKQYVDEIVRVTREIEREYRVAEYYRWNVEEAIVIAFCESGLIPTAKALISKQQAKVGFSEEQSYGLFQVNWLAHGGWLTNEWGWTVEHLMVPEDNINEISENKIKEISENNIKAAYQIYRDSLARERKNGTHRKWWPWQVCRENL